MSDKEYVEIPVIREAPEKMIHDTATCGICQNYFLIFPNRNSFDNGDLIQGEVVEDEPKELEPPC